jgi:hypothetical protein
MKPKKHCRLCDGKRVGNLTICYKHFLARERAKREIKFAKLKDRKKKRVERDHNSYRYLHKTADDLMSKVVRLDGSDENGMNSCYTCGVWIHWKELQAGHFHHGKLDFDKRNRRPQCSQCNKWKSGNLAIFGTKLTEELGVDGMKKLMLDANTKIYTTTELKKIIEELKLTLKDQIE